MLSSPELIKLKLNEAQAIMMEQEMSMRLEIANLVRERDSLLKKSVEMEAEIRKLRRQKADADCHDANQRVEELRRRQNRQWRAKMKMKESDKYKPRLSKDLPDFDENADAGIGSSIKVVSYLTRGCKLETIVLIKNNLHKKNLERFEQSCFGHLLKISDDNLKYQGQLILHLLLHMDKGDSRKGKLVFTVENSQMEFGLGEFCHITGLTDLGTSETTTSSSIHKDVFRSRPSIYIKDVEEAFLKVSHDNGGRGELTLKLAFLYFLFRTLLGYQRKSVDLRYLHLVDDLHKFNVFPWGRVAYKVIFKSISALRGRMDGLAVTDRRCSKVYVSGFIFALQIWAYEVMPFVAECCASRAKNIDKGTPPILHWHAKKILCFRDLEELFAPGDKTGGRRLAHSVKTEDFSTPVAAARDNQGKEPADMRGCSRASATCSDGKVKMRSCDDDHVIVLSDSSDDEAPDTDYCVGEDSNSIHDEQDSDNNSCSDSYINTLVAMLQSRKKRKKNDA